MTMVRINLVQRTAILEAVYIYTVIRSVRTELPTANLLLYCNVAIFDTTDKHGAAVRVLENCRC